MESALGGAQLKGRGEIERGHTEGMGQHAHATRMLLHNVHVTLRPMVTFTPQRFKGNVQVTPAIINILSATEVVSAHALRSNSRTKF